MNNIRDDPEWDNKRGFTVKTTIPFGKSLSFGTSNLSRYEGQKLQSSSLKQNSLESNSTFHIFDNATNNSYGCEQSEMKLYKVSSNTFIIVCFGSSSANSFIGKVKL